MKTLDFEVISQKLSFKRGENDDDADDEMCCKTATISAAFTIEISKTDFMFIHHTHARTHTKKLPIKDEVKDICSVFGDQQCVQALRFLHEERCNDNNSPL